MNDTETNITNIFLGGSCNPTTWRQDIAMPALKAAGVGFYNPQVANWSSELVAVEAKAKAEAKTLLFVIDGQTRAIASILEATEYICSGRAVVLVIDDIVDDTEIDEEEIRGRQLKDLNRARAYLRDLAQRHGVAVHDTVEVAVKAIIEAS